MNIQHTAVVGMQWGDEGKGKIVDHLAQAHDLIVRFQGGTNAGHTVVIGRKKFPLHLIPSGIFYENKLCVIGDGVIVDPVVLAQEITTLDARVKRRAQLLVGSKAHLIMPWHLIRDGLSGKQIGTTMRGIGPTYTDATARMGIRMMDLASRRRFTTLVHQYATYNREMIEALLRYYQIEPAKDERAKIESALSATEIIKTYREAWDTLRAHGVKLVDTSRTLYEADQAGKRILYEGAQAALLDVTHGDYPFVTSSHPTIGGLYHGGGFRPRALKVVGVLKAYTTKVGEGPFVAELTGKVGNDMREKGQEYGTTTGRPRRCGWLDLVVGEYSSRINGIDEIALTKLDILSGFVNLKVARQYMYKERIYKTYPADLEQLTQAKATYQSLVGWATPLTTSKVFSDLPQAAQRYVEYIERTLGIPVRFIGVGPGREELIVR